MNPRAMLFVAMFAAPAWSQDSVTVAAAPVRAAPPPAAQAFDLRSDSVRKIVRDTAATQSASVRWTADDAPAKRQPGADVRVAPPEKAPVPVTQASLPPLPQPARPSSGILTSLIDVLLEEEPDYSSDAYYEGWLRCQSHGDDLKSTTERYETCPNAVRRVPLSR
jgi:hypothetical protein